jgi:S-adenosyl-L-methionine hydrolase (adenosine-forming)
MARPVLTLTTDFGLSDHYVGAMKGVILGICPDAQIADITHEVTPYAIEEGAFLIAQSCAHFPKKTVHVVVVDPGVGSSRRALVMQAEGQYFVGPDNGVFSMIMARAKHTIRAVSNQKYFHHPVSRTFHGRDIFAPVAAWLAKSWQTSSFGEPITDFVRFAMPKPKATGNAIKGVVLKTDHFGNLITNLTASDAPAFTAADGKFTIKVGSGTITKIVPTFAQGAAGEAVAVIGSSGYIEIVVNRGSAAKFLAATRGMEVSVELG